jgi:predicted dehydrogenase
LKAQYGVPLKVYQSYEEMLADPEIDVIDICTPHPYHPEQAIAAANAGKHLIIEKPIALNWEDAKRVRDAIAANGVKAMVCFEVRYSAQFTLTRSIVEQGLLGQLHYAEVDYYHGIGPWYGQYRWNTRKDMGGSALLTAGCHALDALLLCMDDDVDEVTSYATQSASPLFTPYEYQTSATTILRFKTGSVGKTAAVVDCLQPYYFHAHLVGSEGSLLDNKFHSQKLAGLNRHAWSQLSMRMLDSGDVADHPYQTQFQAFFDALDAGTDMPLTSFADAFATHRVIAAADKSAAERRSIKISEIRTE